MIALYVTLWAIAELWARGWSGHSPWFLPGVDPKPLASVFALGLGLGLLLVAISRLIERSPAGQAMQATFIRMLSPLDGRKALVWALSSAVGEELLFRGAMLPSWGFWPATLAFGLLHMAPGRGMWLWTATALAFGAALGGLCQWTGTVAAPIVAHFTVNYLNLRHLWAKATT